LLVFTWNEGRLGNESHTSYRALTTVIGFRTNPTDVLAMAPARRFPWLESFTRAVWLVRDFEEDAGLGLDRMVDAEEEGEADGGGAAEERDE
jgi:hypothetical protein